MSVPILNLKVSLVSTDVCVGSKSRRADLSAIAPSDGGSPTEADQGSRFKVRGSRFEVQGSRFKVRSSKFKVRSSRFEVQSSRFKVQGSKFKVQSSKFKVQGSRFKVQSSRFEVQGSKFKVQSSRFKVQGSGFSPLLRVFASSPVLRLVRRSLSGVGSGYCGGWTPVR